MPLTIDGPKEPTGVRGPKADGPIEKARAVLDPASGPDLDAGIFVRANTETPQQVLVEAESARPLGANAAVWLPSGRSVQAVSDAAVRALAQLYFAKGDTDLNALTASGPELLDEARLFARFKELGSGTFFKVSDLGAIAQRLPDNAEGAAVALRLARAYGVDPGAVQFHGRALLGIRAQQAFRRAPPSAPPEAPEPAAPLGTETLEGVDPGAVYFDVCDEAVPEVARRLAQHHSTLASWLGNKDAETVLQAIRFWARARELGVEGLREPEWETLAFKAEKTPEVLSALGRLAVAYGQDPGEAVPFSAGWAPELEEAAPLGTAKANDDSYAKSDAALPETADHFSGKGWRLTRNWKGPSALDVAGIWARAAELGLGGRLPAIDWSQLGSVMPNSSRGASRALRLCKAYGVDPSTVDFHGTPLSRVRFAGQTHWTALFTPIDEAQRALLKLDKLVGLDGAKQALRRIQRQLELNGIRAKMGLPTDMGSMHAEFLGNPGTGKTTVARIYGEVLHALGRVKKPDFLELSRADLVGQYQGHTAEKAKAALEKGKGGVVFIDEAYSLIQGERDEFGREALDQLIAFMENNRDDTVVILAGYPKEMQRLREANPGLFSRVTQHITFDNYDDASLETIFRDMLQDKGYSADPDDVKLAVRNIARKRKRPDFANAREVRNVVEAAILRQSQRLADLGLAFDPVISKSWLKMLSKEDLLGENAWTPERTKEILAKLDGTLGLDEAKAFIRRIRALVATNRMREAAKLPVVPVSLHSAFLGAPGTGKTMLARIYAQVLACEGALSGGHLIETDRAGLVGKVVGETEDKTLKMLERARGGVLFIDEAYALAKGGDTDFGKQAIDTIVKFMEDNRDDLVVVFAGYPGDMEKLFAMNPGLRSRVGHEILFQNYDDTQLGQIAQKQVEEMGYRLSPELVQALGARFGRQRGQKDFANGRTTRNAVEAAVMAQAERIQHGFEEDGHTPTPDELMELLPKDFGVPDP